MNQQWTFSAFDTLFFKESRPMESIGGSQLGSVFPPPARTIIGAVRTSIGEALRVDWREYSSGPHPLREVMGGPDSLGPLQFKGPYLIKDTERLFPMPLASLHGSAGQTRLVPEENLTACDLGFVRLPIKLHAALQGVKPIEHAYTTARGLQRFLSGMDIPADEIHLAKDLYAHEERLGIARDNQTRVTGDGLLYQTRHIRPLQSANLEIGIQVSGLQAPSLPASGVNRLGAEGRLASWKTTTASELPAVQKPAKAKGLVLMLLSPALFSDGWLPDGFTKDRNDQGHEFWTGNIANIPLRLICGTIGKPVREGGWDMVKHMPRPLNSYVPAGSCYFVEVAEGDLEQAQKALHGAQIGQETAYGRGEIAAGYW